MTINLLILLKNSSCHPRVMIFNCQEIMEDRVQGSDQILKGGIRGHERIFVDYFCEKPIFPENRLL